MRSFGRKEGCGFGCGDIFGLLRGCMMLFNGLQWDAICVHPFRWIYHHTYIHTFPFILSCYLAHW